MIVYAEVMFDHKRNISGEIPKHKEFIYKQAIPQFERWGYKVVVVKAEADFKTCFFHKIMRSKVEGRNGKYVGFPLAGKCIVNRDCKLKPIHRFMKENHLEESYVYVGIAKDEKKRLKSMGKRKISLLDKYGYTEEMARGLCEEHQLLSPIYQYTKRNGCFFCPNAGEAELYELYKEAPMIWRELLEMSENNNLVSPFFNGFKKLRFSDIDKKFHEKENDMTDEKSILCEYKSTSD